MKPVVNVVDDFYDDPWLVRQEAIHAPYESYNKASNYSGHNSMRSFFKDIALAKAKEILKTDKLENSDDTVSGAFRYELEGERGKFDIHTDSFDDYAMVVYLTLPTHCMGRMGTSFFRHKRTGLYTVPGPETSKNLGFTTPWELKEGFTVEDGNKRELWDNWFSVPMRYNRAVIFDSKYWHGSERGFGTTIDNGRLVQIFFFKVTK